MALCLSLAALSPLFFANSAHAAFYDVIFCAAGNDAGNPTLGARPGFFDFGTHCEWSTSYPSGGNSNEYLRLSANTSSGSAGYNDEASISWYAPSWTSIVAGGGYTREPADFNQGWRARFWGEDFGGGVHNILLQGAGIEGTGSEPFITKNTTSIFAAHLWPYGGWDDYKRFVFALWCVRSSGCSRAGFVAADANTITLVANDKKDPEVSFVDGATVRGEWVRGYQVLAWNEHDYGSGLRFSRLGTDGGVFGDGTIDYQANGGCRIGYRDGSREFGKSLDPCTPGPYLRYYGFETKNVSDGQHELAICLQDYSQYINSTNTCDRRTIRTDNHAPSAPASLAVASANPARYLSHFGVNWKLPANTGSPITKIHHQIVNADEEVVVPTQTVSGTNLQSLADVTGPSAAGAYKLRLWLEDQVGFVGPMSTVAIPHDTTPPPAPQNLRVVAPSTAHRVPKFDLRWDNAADPGSPIDTAHFQVIDDAGNVAGQTGTVVDDGLQASESVQEIQNVETPAPLGSYRARVWLVDEEGNAGAASTVAVPRDTTPPAAPQDVSVTAPDTSKAADGFDVRWRNIADAGSPINQVHYDVLNPVGQVAVPARTITASNPTSIADIEAPKGGGAFALRLWLSDEEGNVGAPATVPLSYRCVRSDSNAGRQLSANVGGAPSRTVKQGRGATMSGALRFRGAPVAGVPVCIFSNVVTDPGRAFLGLAVTGASGTYNFAIPAGPSRNLIAIYRPDHRELTARARVETIVRPAFKVRRRVLKNRQRAHFYGRIPGPHNDRVVIVLQARVGKGWLAFRRYRTRRGGRFKVSYRFHRTGRRTTYVMRAQVRQTTGYPYLQGNSRRLKIRVLPKKRRHRR